MIRYGKYTKFSRGSFLLNLYFYFHVPHIGVHKHSRLTLIFDLLYTASAHEGLPVSLVDSVTAKVDDEEKDLAYSIYMWYTSCYILLNELFIYFLCGFYMLFMHSIYIPYTLKVKTKVKKWRPEKLKMVKKHFFPELSGDLWGVICYHHWYPRAGLEGSEKNRFSKKVLRSKKMQNHPLSLFHAAVRPESLPGADLSTF